jgi:hypothetical protein
VVSVGAGEGVWAETMHGAIDIAAQTSSSLIFAFMNLSSLISSIEVCGATSGAAAVLFDLRLSAI